MPVKAIDFGYLNGLCGLSCSLCPLLTAKVTELLIQVETEVGRGWEDPARLDPDSKDSLSRSLPCPLGTGCWLPSC